MKHSGKHFFIEKKKQKTFRHLEFFLNVLVWQWGRRGAGPRYAMMLADGLAKLPDTRVELSLSHHVASSPEIWSVPTYTNIPTFLLRLLTAPVFLLRLRRHLLARPPTIAICAMAGPLDLLMAFVLPCPFALVVHDATPHPGDGMPFQATLQRWLIRRAAALIVLSTHVGNSLLAQNLVGPRKLILSSHPPFDFSTQRAARLPGPPRLLFFGRLLPYKGLDLLAEALTRLGAAAPKTRIVGIGPESPTLAELRALPNVTVENRWVAENEVGALLAWADAVILPYREASQSGIAAAALAAGAWVLATNVGGLPEQLADHPATILCAPHAASIAHAIAAIPATAAPPPRQDMLATWHTSLTHLLADLRSL